MRNTHGTTTAPSEQTGDRQWSWDVRDEVPFRRLSTVFGCRSVDADRFEAEFFNLGKAHPDFPLLLVDPKRSEREDRWSGITYFHVDYLGAHTDDDEAQLFKPHVVTLKERYQALGSVAGGGGGSTGPRAGNFVIPVRLPTLIVTHVHQEEIDLANYCVYLDPPRPPRAPDIPFYDRRLFVMSTREKIQIGGYWQYTDRFDIPSALGLGSENATELPKAELASFIGCTAEDTFQDRLDRNGVILSDYELAALKTSTAAAT